MHEVAARRLDGKVALITGAGQQDGREIGNGRATAIAFAREGARLVLMDVDEASGQATADAVAEEGGEATLVLGDVASDEDAARAVSTAVDRFGSMDVLHHNVGIVAGDNWAEHIEIENWERILRVNAGGAMLMAKHAVPAMRDSGGGAITNVSSIASIAAGVTAWSNSPLGYKMSKAALNALTESLALNYASIGIRANAILPGLIDTPMGVDTVAVMLGIDRDDYAAMRNEAVPLRGGMGSARDVANAAVFLASDEASFITGVMLPVDGGQTARVG